VMEVQSSQDAPLLPIADRARNAVRNIRGLVQGVQPWYDHVGKCEFNRGTTTVRLKRKKKLRTVGDMEPNKQAYLLLRAPHLLLECADVLDELLKSQTPPLPIRSHESDQTPEVQL